MMQPTRQTEMLAGIGAVRKAATVCRAVQARMIQPETLAKKDKSPVTVADFASQAVVCRLLSQQLPVGDNPVVGEEGSAELRKGDQAMLRGAVVEQVRGALGDKVSETEVLDWIDLGGHEAKGSSRFWTLDPIDGTKGFLRKEQYAIALALLENGKITLGLLGCPQLDGGVLLIAERGRGAWKLPLWNGAGLDQAQPIHVNAITETSAARFCESVESGHSDQDASVLIAKDLGITRDAVRLDSQAKYAVLAQGQAEIYLRLPTPKLPDYRENIWDHAAGTIVIEEADGKVTDATGRPLDFSLGSKLVNNKGVVATCGPIHDRVIAAVVKHLV